MLIGDDNPIPAPPALLWPRHPLLDKATIEICVNQATLSALDGLAQGFVTNPFASGKRLNPLILKIRIRLPASFHINHSYSNQGCQSIFASADVREPVSSQTRVPDGPHSQPQSAPAVVYASCTAQSTQPRHLRPLHAGMKCTTTRPPRRASPSRGAPPFAASRDEFELTPGRRYAKKAPPPRPPPDWFEQFGRRA